MSVEFRGCLQLKELSIVLHPFLETTQAMQSEREVTISLVVPLVVGLCCHLRNLQPVHLVQMAAALKWSLEVLFGSILVIAGLMPMPQDPGDKPLKFN